VKRAAEVHFYKSKEGNSMYNYFIERCDNCVIHSGEQLQLL
jgi:hypothetical protein